MDNSDNTRRAETTEYASGRLASIPSLSQLKELQEEAMRAEGREIVREDPPVVFASERFPSGIPSASQLRSLQSQEQKDRGVAPSEDVPERAAARKSAAPAADKPQSAAYRGHLPEFMRRVTQKLHTAPDVPAPAARQSAPAPAAKQPVPAPKPAPAVKAPQETPAEPKAQPQTVPAPAVKAAVPETAAAQEEAPKADAKAAPAPDAAPEKAPAHFSRIDLAFAELFAAQKAFTIPAAQNDQPTVSGRSEAEKPAPAVSTQADAADFIFLSPAAESVTREPAEPVETPTQEIAEEVPVREPEEISEALMMEIAEEAPALEPEEIPEAQVQETAEEIPALEPEEISETQTQEAAAAKPARKPAKPAKRKANAGAQKAQAAEETAQSPKGKSRTGKKKESSLEKYTGSVLESLPTAEQIRNSKPKRSRASSADLPGVPSERQLIRERRRLNYRGDFFKVIRNTVFTLITVSAIAVLVAVLLLPVLRIYGASMTPALYESDIVLSIKGGKFTTGDIVAFYYNNKILVKRVIAQAGDWVNIDKDGTVSVNGVVLDEPYVQSKAFGECDIELPYQVPEDRVFVMGDYRDVSIDSRSTAIGAIAKDQVVGRIIYRIWPLEVFGKIE